MRIFSNIGKVFLIDKIVLIGNLHNYFSFINVIQLLLLFIRHKVQSSVLHVLNNSFFY